MSKKTVRLTVALMVASLVGLVVLQTALLSNAWELKEQAFRRSVLSALSAAADQLETRETSVIAYSTAVGSDSALQIGMYMFGMDSVMEDSVHFWEGEDTIAPRVRLEEDALILNVPTPQRVIVQFMDTLGILDTTVIDTCGITGEHEFSLSPDLLINDMRMVRSNTDTGTTVVCIQAGYGAAEMTPWTSIRNGDMDRQIRVDVTAADSGRFEYIQEIVARLANIEAGPIEQRLDSAVLDSVIKQNLVEAGVDLAPAFGVYSSFDGTISMASPDDSRGELAGSDLRTRLFPHDVFSPRHELVLHFPDRVTFLAQQIGPHLLSTVLFVLIIVFCFVYTIRTIMAQRRNATLMVDFVNNMTHEFKTPISTVALACEAILRPDVISDKDKVGRFSQMIQNENRRMRSQTEKILQMAALEDSSYDLKLSEVDLHIIIRAAVDNIALQVEHVGGSIECDLAAGQHVIALDKVHVASIIHNLLDNANKYSPDKPRITVSTTDDPHGVFVSIEDEGIGIPEEDQKMVFDKYFRVSSGNIHDVKGFGLGLSYVKMMVLAHGGEVSLKSEAGKGTTVRLFLPFTTQAE